MKKFSKIMAICLAIALVFSLAACGNPSAPDPDSVKSEKVADAEAWAKAFDFSEVKNAIVKMTFTEKDGDDTYTGELYGYLDGDKSYSKTVEPTEEKNEDGTFKTEVFETYTAKEGDKYYSYRYDDEKEKWFKYEVPANQVDMGLDGIMDGADEMIKIAFSQFKYDDEKNAYVMSVGEGEYQIKITDGKVSVMKMVMGDNTTVIQIYGLGKASVTLPEAELGTEDAE